MSVGEFWPEKGIQSNEWKLIRRDSAPAALSGDSVAVPLGEPYWEIDVSVTVEARSLLARQWSAFFARREGMKNTFTANRSFQTFPFQLADIPAGFNIHSIDRELRRIILQNVGAYRGTEGDMISYFTAESGYYIGEVDSVPVSTSTQLIAHLQPAPFPMHPTTPNLRVTKAVGEFRLSAVPRPVEKAAKRSWSFKAMQVIRG